MDPRYQWSGHKKRYSKDDRRGYSERKDEGKMKWSGQQGMKHDVE